MHLLNNLSERLIALDFLHYQLARHVGKSDLPERDLTVNMLVREESEKIEQVGELINEVLTSLSKAKGEPSRTAYIS